VEFAGLLIPVDIFNFLVGEYHLSPLYQQVSVFCAPAGRSVSMFDVLT